MAFSDDPDLRAASLEAAFGERPILCVVFDKYAFAHIFSQLEPDEVLEHIEKLHDALREQLEERGH